MLEKEAILNRTNRGLQVFKHYISQPIRLGRNFFNPLYEDKKASCNIYFDKNSNQYKIKDFGNSDYSGDCFFFVGSLHSLNCNNAIDFVEILKIIDRDLSLGLQNGMPVPVQIIPQKETEFIHQEKREKIYRFSEQEFLFQELSYWENYGISEKLLAIYQVCSIREFTGENKEGQPFTIYSSENEPIFGYKGKGYIKLYRPFSQIRFLYGGNLPDNYCFGLEQLPTKGDTLFITGGEKDVLSLAANGFHAICFNSETSSIPETIIYKLSFRFKHLVLLYDVDKTGLEASKKHQQLLSKYSVKRLILPLTGAKDQKDISDYFILKNSRKSLINLFLRLLENLYSDTMIMLRSCEIDFNNPPIKQQEIISAKDIPIGTVGNLFCITGGEGTGKSNYVAALIAGSICRNTQIDTLGINVSENTNKKAVLLYDTEQSEVQLFKNVTNLLRRADLKEKPEEFRAFCLTAMSRKERLQAIIQSMDKYYYQYGGIQLVVIDGVADLIRSANDEIESVSVIDELYRLAGIYNTCIICVLHFVPNGLKLRGHLGSELQRKASAILSIELDHNSNLSIVKAIKLREGSPLDVPLMLFGWDKEKAMHVYKGEKPREEKEKRKEKELIQVAKEIFQYNEKLSYSDLVIQIQQNLSVKERTAKNYVSFMREKNIISKDTNKENLYILSI